MKRIILALTVLDWVLGASAQEQPLAVERAKKGRRAHAGDGRHQTSTPALPSSDQE